MRGDTELAPRPVGAADEWRRLVTPLINRSRRAGVCAVPFTLITLVGVAALAGVNDAAAGHHFIRAWFDEYANLPARATALRMIPSVIAPAYRLPVWGALLQIAFVLGVAEATYGTRVVAFVALSAHVVATLSARAFIWVGPHDLIGLAAKVAHYPDAGPSAATVGVAAFVVIATRGRQTLVALLVFCVGEWFVHPGLAQREHLVAALVGVALAFALRDRLPSERADPRRIS